MRRAILFAWLVSAAIAQAQLAQAQQITAMVAPFVSSKTNEPAIGEKASIILNLQIWQTLRIPPTGEGKNTRGGVTWDVTSKPPMSYAEAEELAQTQIEDKPQIVLWGRASRYGSGYVVEAFLLIRSDLRWGGQASDLWKVALPGGGSVRVGIPRQQIDFKPIVLRSDILAELKDPSGLKLYANPSGDVILGTVGDYFRALEQGVDSAKVILPNGTRGWVRLPNLSREDSEVVYFSGALIRMLRQDWIGAKGLFLRVVNNPNTPTNVRIDSYLYIAVAADRTGEDSYPWLRRAYQLNPYSKTVVQYLCMSHLAALSRMDVADLRGAKGSERRKSLQEIVEKTQPMFPADDAWLLSIKAALAKLH